MNARLSSEAPGRPQECRIWSPDSGFSTLMTSAPRSASTIVQYGPAITWVRSRMVSPDGGAARGAVCSPAVCPPVVWSAIAPFPDACSDDAEGPECHHPSQGDHAIDEGHPAVADERRAQRHPGQRRADPEVTR